MEKLLLICTFSFLNESTPARVRVPEEIFTVPPLKIQLVQVPLELMVRVTPVDILNVQGEQLAK
jgi:hypothetical protein